jgi:hypothetical protein
MQTSALAAKHSGLETTHNRLPDTHVFTFSCARCGWRYSPRQRVPDFLGPQPLITNTVHPSWKLFHLARSNSRQHVNAQFSFTDTIFFYHQWQLSGVMNKWWNIVVLVSTVTACRVRRGTAPLICIFGTRYRWVVSFMLQPLYPRGKQHPVPI